ncbi:hypothetical protein AAG570_010380 [Ranatra chinensis]|uniref:Mos1 transposase HTH domain-containing protein n=1 Tax=Ranatra chinensis TaxID=642074 RepID=A0ABD0YMD1_9HEMI
MEATGASGTVSVEVQRSYIKIESLRGKTPTEIHSALREVCGDQTVDRSTVSRWANRFREGRVSVQDDQRSGRPKTATDERGVKLVADFIGEDRRVTCDEISYCTGISPTSVYRILTEVLHKRKVCSCWVPDCLTAEQKKKRLDIATCLKTRFDIEGEAFLFRIIVIDELCIRNFEPESKLQSNLRNKKLRQEQPKVKQMIMIFAYDHQGIIMAHRVPHETTVIESYYFEWLQKLHRKLHKNRPHLLQKGPLILHDSGLLYMGENVNDLLTEYGWAELPHLSYSPDMSPSDFDLYPKLKEPLRGQHFSSLEEISSAVTQAIQGLNKSGSLQGITNLPRRWDAVSDKQGDYFEGVYVGTD